MYFVSITYQKIGDLLSPVHISGIPHGVKEVQFQKRKKSQIKTSNQKSLGSQSRTFLSLVVLLIILP